MAHKALNVLSPGYTQRRLERWSYTMGKKEVAASRSERGIYDTKLICVF